MDGTQPESTAAQPSTLNLDQDSFERIAALVHAESGIVLSESKKSLTVSRLSRRVRHLGLSTFRDYCDVVEKDAHLDERREMLFMLTTNVTRFFREKHHFDALKTKILPPLVQRAKTGGRVRIWSAGCSSGEEPYSIAMTVLEAMPDAQNFDIKILATDLDANMVSTARKGIYRRVEDGQLSAEFRSKYCDTSTSEPEELAISDGPRGLISFGDLNLLKPWPMSGPFDVIFCRNVVIYFDNETQSKLWKRFSDILSPNGHLIVGHSERVTGAASEDLRATGITQYEKQAFVG